MRVFAFDRKEIVISKKTLHFDLGMADPEGNLLVVVVDVNPRVWSQLSGTPKNPVTFGHVMEHLIMFINSHLALRFDNRLAIIASTSNRR
jgi:transcription initiation factor TFIIH subunit 3